jgi:hypothetical protein
LLLGNGFCLAPVIFSQRFFVNYSKYFFFFFGSSSGGDGVFGGGVFGGGGSLNNPEALYQFVEKDKGRKENVGGKI